MDREKLMPSTALLMGLLLPAGRMTDRLGYKIPILAGTCGICVALLMAWWWPALTTLYFTATLLGISFMAFQIATQTLVGAMSTPENRANNFNWISLGFATANFTGPLLSGILIDQIGHTRTFFALAMPLVPAIIISALGSRWMPDVHTKSEQQSSGSFDLLKIKPLRNAMIASAIGRLSAPARTADGGLPPTATQIGRSARVRG